MPKVLIPGLLTLGQATPLGYDPAQRPGGTCKRTLCKRRLVSKRVFGSTLVGIALAQVVKQ